jgi:hypothetical protein
MASAQGRLLEQDAANEDLPADMLAAESVIAGAGQGTGRARHGCCGPKSRCFAAGALCTVAGLMACVIPVYFFVIGSSVAEDDPSALRAPRAPADLNATATVSSLALSVRRRNAIVQSRPWLVQATRAARRSAGTIVC